MDENRVGIDENRRSGIDRRRISFTIHMPERRFGKERRIEGRRGRYSEPLTIRPHKPGIKINLSGY